MREDDPYLMALGGPQLVVWHKMNGTHRSAKAYLDLYRDQLTRGLHHTRLLYLDTNFWVWLRDAYLGRGTRDATRLLEILRAMVRSREALCISQLHSFLEVGKQTGESLRASADLIDELSEGVAIASQDDLQTIECGSFVQDVLGRNVAHGLSVWVKAGQLHSGSVPTKLPGPATPAQREAILKAAIDSFWNAPFSLLFERFDWNTKTVLNPDLDPEVFAKVAKRKNDQLARKLTRDQVRRDEFASVVAGQLLPTFMQILTRWHAEHQFPEGVGAMLRDAQTVAQRAIERFAHRALGKSLPTYALPTELYAMYETEPQRTRPLTNNDWLDWRHAAAALPYCDVFFTEKGLAHRLTIDLKADVQYECQVVGNLQAAVAYLSRD